MTTPRSQWADIVAANPDHSHQYAQRFRRLAAEGSDIYGEARLLDAMLPRGARVLDAGCGGGRSGGYLAHQGHQVVGVDLDPVLIEAAQQDFPGPTWLVGDLAELNLPARGVADPFDGIVCAGNVMTFLHPETRVEVLRRFGRHLASRARAVIGFGAGRGYPFDEFFRHAQTAGLVVDLSLATWDLRPWHEGADFLVAVLSRGETDQGT
jgi:SAM-dependent methyltransferase